MRTISIIVFLSILSLKALSVTRTAVANTGNGWSVASNWSPSGVPQDGDTVIIPTGFELRVKGNIYSTPYPNIFLNIYGTLDFDPSGKLELGVNSIINVQSNAMITSNESASELIRIGGVIMFNGLVDGTINGPAHSTSSYGPSPNGFMPGILPVKLLGFFAIKNNRNITLKWTTLSEVNTKRFEVEKSSNSTNWSVLRVIEAFENNTSTNDYTVTDSYPGNGKNFYRLKTIDQNDKHEYSKILLVSGTAETAKLKMYPNPATSHLNIALTGIGSDGPMTLLLTNIDGKILKRIPVICYRNSITIDLTDLPKGIYNLSMVSQSNNKYIQYFVIQ